MAVFYVRQLDYITELNNMLDGVPAFTKVAIDDANFNGYVAAQWEFLTTLHPCVGYSDERIELFLARDLSFEGHPGEDDEFIEVVQMSVDEALEKVFAREITEAKTILGVLWADRLRRG